MRTLLGGTFFSDVLPAHTAEHHRDHSVVRRVIRHGRSKFKMETTNEGEDKSGKNWDDGQEQKSRKFKWGPALLIPWPLRNLLVGHTTTSSRKNLDGLHSPSTIAFTQQETSSSASSTSLHLATLPNAILPNVEPLKLPPTPIIIHPIISETRGNSVPSPPPTPVCGRLLNQKQSLNDTMSPKSISSEIMLSSVDYSYDDSGSVNPNSDRQNVIFAPKVKQTCYIETRADRCLNVDPYPLPPPPYVATLLNSRNNEHVVMKLEFLGFLSNEPYRESVLFYYSFQRLKRCVRDDSANMKDFVYIYSKFVSNEATHPIVIPSYLRLHLKKHFEKFCLGLANISALCSSPGIRKSSPLKENTCISDDQHGSTDVLNALNEVNTYLVDMLQKDPYRRFLARRMVLHCPVTGV